MIIIAPRLVRRSEWGADLMGKYTLRSISKNVLISSTGGPSCNTKVSIHFS